MLQAQWQQPYAARFKRHWFDKSHLMIAIALLMFLAISPAPGKLQTQPTAQANQDDAKNAVVAVARIKDIQAEQPTNPPPQQRTANKANGVRQAFNEH